MTTYFPISETVPQYEDSSGNPYSGAVLKAYAAGTSTPISIATDYAGGTLVSTVVLNASGFPAVSGNVIIPHLAVNYKLALYPDATSAASNTGAIWSVDNIQISSASGHGPLTDVASATTTNLNSTLTDYFNITGTTTITGITLAEGSQVTVKFAGILTLTNGAFLITGTGSNITTAAGDTASFRGEAGGVVRVLWYRRADGTALSISSGALTDLVSATTTDLGTIASRNVRITGTTTITGFGNSASLTSPIYLIEFSGSLILTHNGTSLIIPGAANITTAAGDTAVVEFLGTSNWRVREYNKNSGKAVISGIVAGTPVTINPYTVNTTTTTAHGLVAEPTFYKMVLECLSADLSYSTGNKVVIPLTARTTSGVAAYQVFADATNYTFITHVSDIFDLLNASTRAAGVGIDVSKWKITITPYLVS